MKTLSTLRFAAGMVMVMAAGAVAAQDGTTKTPPMDGNSMPKKTMTIKECEDHMGMARSAAMKKDAALIKKDSLCGDMTKKDGDAMRREVMRPAEPMKK